MKLLMLSLFLSVLLQSSIYSQEKIIVLSSKVGSHIDKDEKLKYHLFPHSYYFDSGVIKQIEDSIYVDAHLNYDGVEKDSLLLLSINDLFIMAELIDNYDAIKEGSYIYGRKNVNLFYDDGSHFSYDTSAYKLSMKTQDIKNVEIKKESQDIKNVEIKKEYDPDILRYVYNEKRIKWEPKFQWGFGLGLSNYNYNLEGVEEYKKRLNISMTPDYERDIIITFNTFIKYSEMIYDFQFIVGTANFQRTSIGILYNPDKLSNSFLHPFIGVSYNSIDFKKTYASSDSVYVGSVGHKLKEVELKKNTYAFTISCGASIDYKSFQLWLKGNYLIDKKTFGNSDLKEISIDLSGLYLEAKIMYVLGRF